MLLTLPYPVPLHDIVAIVHHLVVDSLAITTNFILIASIIVASPPCMKSYKLILLCSALNDVVAGVMRLGAMSRIVPAAPVLAHFYIGPCTIVSGYLRVSCLCETRIPILGNFCYVLESILFATLAFSTAQDDSRLVVEALRLTRPTYSVDSYFIRSISSMSDTVSDRTKAMHLALCKVAINIINIQLYLCRVLSAIITAIMLFPVGYLIFSMYILRLCLLVHYRARNAR
ncbi:hypothetical protein PRIPAC_76786, partial [Pristionchus pacificus]|uniref:G protein-coupled receptor n=1 Tax=Pristionchus pacificus TaxID=54126 RepID=A0A2A6CMQ0_PRIPA